MACLLGDANTSCQTWQTGSNDGWAYEPRLRRMRLEQGGPDRTGPPRVFLPDTFSCGCGCPRRLSACTRHMSPRSPAAATNNTMVSCLSLLSSWILTVHDYDLSDSHVVAKKRIFTLNDPLSTCLFIFLVLYTSLHLVLMIW